MKILVINEPYVKDFCRTQRWAARSRARVLRAPDWLGYATSVLEAQGHDVTFVDMVASGQTKDDLRNIVKKENPDFVILDSTTPSIYSDIECASIVKKESRASVIMVGPHVSALPEETLLLAQGVVDVVCIGEYDYTVRDVVARFNHLSEIEGIAYYTNGSVRRNNNRALIEDLDQLPFPAWQHLDLMRYYDASKLYPYIDVISGRGCPNGCIFCLWPQVMHGMRYRLRSPGNVVDELERDITLCPRVQKTGEFFFEDDTFTVDKPRAIAICEEILKRNLNITFSVNARVDTGDKELFAMLKKAGCRMLLVGFESGSSTMLDTMHKNISIEQSRQFMDYAKQAKLDVHGCFVIGLPGETEASAQETINHALTLGLTTVQFSGAVPFPGTKFFTLCKENQWIKKTRWSDWLDSGEQTGIVEYPGFSQARINYYVDQGLKKFYFRFSYIVNFILVNRSWSDVYRKVRGAWNFVAYLIFKK